MSVLVKPVGGGDSGDEMMEVLVVGLCSVEKKEDRSDNRRLAGKVIIIVEDNLTALVGMERAECRFFKFIEGEEKF